MVIFRKYDASVRVCSGGGCVVGRFVGGSAEVKIVEEAAEGATYFSITVRVYYSVD